MLNEGAHGRLLRAKLLAAKIVRLLEAKERGDAAPRQTHDRDCGAQFAAEWAQKKKDIVRKRICKSQGGYCRLLTAKHLPILHLDHLFERLPYARNRPADNPFHATPSAVSTPKSKDSESPFFDEENSKPSWMVRSPCFGVRKDSSEHSEEMPLVSTDEKLDLTIEKRAFQPIENTLKNSELKQTDDKADQPSPTKRAWQQHPGNFKPWNYDERSKPALPHINN